MHYLYRPPFTFRVYVCLRSQNGTLAKALEKWYDELVRARKALKVALMWRNHALGRAWRQWTFYVWDKQRLRALSERVVARWKFRTLSKAWEAWYEHHIQIAMEKEGNAELERLKKMMARMAMKKWMNASLARAWNKWRHELRRTRLGKKVAKRWTHRTLSKAWVSWGTMVAEKKRLRAVAKKVVARWKHRVIAQAWQSWLEDHLQKKRLRHLTSQALSRWKVRFVSLHIAVRQVPV